MLLQSAVFGHLDSGFGDTPDEHLERESWSFQSLRKPVTARMLLGELSAVLVAEKS